MYMQLRLTYRVSSSATALPTPQWITQKLIPSVEEGPASLNQTVWTAPSEAAMGDAWEASATLDMYEAPGHELHYLRPREIVSARYWGNIQITIGFGQVLHSG